MYIFGHHRYLPYGGARFSAGITETDFGFTGQRSLAEVGLMDYNARWYGPSISRFVSADTIVPGAGNPAALNRYGYVYSNPLLYTDPSGHYIIEGYEDDPYWSYSSPGNLLLGPTPVPPPTPLEDENGNGEDVRKGPIDPLSTAEKVMVIITGGLVVTGFTVAEVSLAVAGVTALQFGPPGIVFDTLIVAPMELLLIDVEIGILRYIYDSVKAGSRDGAEFQWTLFEFLNKPQD